MKNFKQKQCSVCGKEYLPTGQNSKYCSDECKKIILKEKQPIYSATYFRKQGRVVGVGSGGLTGSGKDNFMYIHGRCTFRRWAKERKQSIGICENCGKDIKNATHHEWVGHHKDHNQMNNTIENLVLLCKKCHQIEHQCWKAFEGVTTISKESRVDNNSKRLTLLQEQVPLEKEFESILFENIWDLYER